MLLSVNAIMLIKYIGLCNETCAFAEWIIIWLLRLILTNWSKEKFSFIFGLQLRAEYCQSSLLKESYWEINATCYSNKGV